MYVRCYDCDWSQDDFWSESYYPTRNSSVIQDFLLPGIIDSSKRQIKMSQSEADERGFPYDEVDVSGMVDIDFRAYVGYEIMNLAKRIMSQYWVTYEDFDNDISKRCPICNSTNLVTD